MSNAAGRIKAGSRLTTDLITFAAIVFTIIVLACVMIVAPIAIASWYIPDLSRTNDNLPDQVRKAEQIAPADPLTLDVHCATASSGCFHKLGDVVEEVPPPTR